MGRLWRRYGRTKRRLLRLPPKTGSRYRESCSLILHIIYNNYNKDIPDIRSELSPISPPQRFINEHTRRTLKCLPSVHKSSARFMTRNQETAVCRFIFVKRAAKLDRWSPIGLYCTTRKIRRLPRMAHIYRTYNSDPLTAPLRPLPTTCTQNGHCCPQPPFPPLSPQQIQEQRHGVASTKFPSTRSIVSSFLDGGTTQAFSY